MSKTTVGIDIGTYQVKVIIARTSDANGGMPKIIGSGFAESKGLRHGYIINQTDAIRSIRKAIREAEKESGFKIERAYVSIGGIGLSSQVASGTVMVSRADSEITELDIEKATKESQDQLPKSFIQNRQIIHSIPVEYKIDGKQILGHDPVGMKGTKLDIKMLYIASLSHHLQELIQTIESAGVEIIDVMAAPLAAGLVNLSKTEKIAGCVLTNIGSETVSIVVYEDDIPVSLEVFPIGSNDITNDIALGLKVSLDQAERIKLDRASGYEITDVSKTDLNKIISTRLSDIFALIDSHLKKIGKNGLLPAGIILTGGGSGVIDINDLAKSTLNLPSKIAKITNKNAGRDTNNVKTKDSKWSVAYGLCVFGLHSDDEGSISLNVGKKLFKSIIRGVSNWFKKFLP
jgi:cell division protein FtsA